MGNYVDSMTLEENALAIAHSFLGRRVLSRWPGMLDAQEAKQDLALFVLEHMDGWEPERGALATHVGNLFDMWWRGTIWRRKAEAEHTYWFDPAWLLLGEDEDFPDSRALPHPMIDARRLLRECAPQPNHEKSELVDVLLSLLTEEQRPVAELVYGYGLSHSQAGEVLGISKGQANGRAQRALKTWRECWERDVA